MMKTLRNMFIQMAIAVLIAVFALGQDTVDTRTGHAGEVAAIALSPDSKLIASAGKDATVRIWNLDTGREIARIAPKADEGEFGGGGDETVYCVVFSPDGKLLAAAYDSVVNVWTVGEWADATTEIDNANIEFLAFSPDSTRLAMAERKPEYAISVPGYERTPNVEIWDIEADMSSDTFPGGYGPIAFHPDGKMLVFTNEEGVVFFKDLESTDDDAPGTKLKSDDDRVAVVAFNKKGDHLYTLAGGGLMSEGGVRVWRTADRKLASKFDIKSDDLILAHPNGKDIVIAGGAFDQTSLSVVDPMKGVAISSVERADANVGTPAAISSDGKFVVAVDKHNHDIQIIDLAAAKIKTTLKGHSIFVTSLAFSFDDKTLVSGYDNGTLIAWDHGTGKAMKLVKTETPPVRDRPIFFETGEEEGDVLLAPDAKRYLIGRAANKIYDSASGKTLAKLPEPMASTETSFSADGSMVAISERRTVRIFDASSGNIKKQFPVVVDKYQTPSTTAFSPDGKLIAVCGVALSIRDVVSGLVKKAIPASSGCKGDLAISSDGKHVVSGMASGITVYSTATGRVVFRHKEKDPIFSLSHDGKSLTVVSVLGNLEHYDLFTGKPIFEREAIVKMGVSNICLNFSHDGKLIAVGTDRGVQLFDSTTGELVRKMQ